MKAKLVNTHPRTHLVVFDDGDDVLNLITEFVADKQILSAQLTGIGAFSNATLGYFDFSIKDYRKMEVHEQVEVVSFIGNISIYKNHPKLHAHVVLGRSDSSTMGGHFLNGTVHPTLELFITETTDHFNRKIDTDINIPLIVIE
jgi:predicted DNA-binding protein with PD1-like motif